eukprot:gene16127-18227_t
MSSDTPDAHSILCFTHRSPFGHLGTDLHVGATQPDDLPAEFDTNDAGQLHASIAARRPRGSTVEVLGGASGHRDRPRYHRQLVPRCVSLCVPKSGLCSLARTISSATPLVGMSARRRSRYRSLKDALRSSTPCAASLCEVPSIYHELRVVTPPIDSRVGVVSWCSAFSGGALPSPRQPRLPLSSREQVLWDALQRIVQHVRDPFAAPLRARLRRWTPMAAAASARASAVSASASSTAAATETPIGATMDDHLTDRSATRSAVLSDGSWAARWANRTAVSRAVSTAAPMDSSVVTAEDASAEPRGAPELAQRRTAVVNIACHQSACAASCANHGLSASLGDSLGCAVDLLLPHFWAVDIHLTLQWCSGISRTWTTATSRPLHCTLHAVEVKAAQVSVQSALRTAVQDPI